MSVGIQVCYHVWCTSARQPSAPKTPWQCGKTPHIPPANLVKFWLSPLPQLFPTQPIVPGKVQHGPPKWQVWFLSANIPGLHFRFATLRCLQWSSLASFSGWRMMRPLRCSNCLTKPWTWETPTTSIGQFWFLMIPSSKIVTLGRLTNPKPPNSPKDGMMFLLQQITGQRTGR